MEKRCLNCRNFIPDDDDLDGDPIPQQQFSSTGLCVLTGKRMQDGWSCGKWEPHPDPEKKRKDCPLLSTCRQSRYAERADDYCYHDSLGTYDGCPSYLEYQRKLDKIP